MTVVINYWWICRIFV